jgi:hypothetical protein
MISADEDSSDVSWIKLAIQGEISCHQQNRQVAMSTVYWSEACLRLYLQTGTASLLAISRLVTVLLRSAYWFLARLSANQS